MPIVRVDREYGTDQDRERNAPLAWNEGSCAVKTALSISATLSASRKEEWPLSRPTTIIFISCTTGN